MIQLKKMKKHETVEYLDEEDKGPDDTADDLICKIEE